MGGITIRGHNNNVQQKKEELYKTKCIILVVYAISFIVFGFIIDKPQTIIDGLRAIIVGRDILITDYIEVGGIGACFVNSGLLTLISIIMLYMLRIDLDGRSYVAIFLMSGFALFGKNLLNVWMILLGVYLYTRFMKEKFSDHVNTALLGTSLAPVFSELLFHIDKPFWFRVIAAILASCLIGFVLPPLSAHLFKTHMGYNLYNVGFAAGIIGTVIVSLSISYGYEIKYRLLWSRGNDLLLGSFMTIIFLFFIVTGYFLNSRSFKGIISLLKSGGRLVSDYIQTDGLGVSLINMGINGFVGMAYVLAVGGPLNGPTIGGILTIVGFGAYGKHARNIIPLILGVFIGVFTKIWEIDDPRLLLAALFGTALAPISSVFGWPFGILAGFINSSVVLSVGVLHGGMNLYNTGFSCGLVASIMVPIVKVLKKVKNDNSNT